MAVRTRNPAPVAAPKLHAVRDHLLDLKSFLRFGAFGRGASRVRLDEEFRQEVLGGKNFEAGLSVYEAEVLDDGRVRLETPDRRRAAYHADGDYLRDMLAGFSGSIARGEVYLVTGRVVATEYERYDDSWDEMVLIQSAVVGSDGEPLLEPHTVRRKRRFSADEALDLILTGGRPIGDVKLWYGRTLRSAVEDVELPEPRRRVRKAAPKRRVPH